jgi:hypothetical protein
MERAQMVAAAAPFVIALMASSVVVSVAYKLGVRDRNLKPALVLLFKENDPAYVRPLRGLHDQYGEFYSIGVLNKSSMTLTNVLVRALDSHFTQAIIAPARFHPRDLHYYKRGPVKIYEFESLHPGAGEIIELF